MSRNVKSTPVTKNGKKPICTFCLNLGKTESEYSHYTYALPDSNGKTKALCPELLSTECKYCFKLGHTVKYCPELKHQEKGRAKADRKAKAAEVEKTKPKVQEKKSGSVFAGLIDSDSEDEQPVLSGPAEVAAVKSSEMKTNWAAIVAKPAEAPRHELNILSNFVKLERKSVQKKTVESKPAPWAKKTPVITKSWADWSDSEDEDDEYEAYEEYAVGSVEEEDF
jgi:hypothetical protein